MGSGGSAYAVNEDGNMVGDPPFAGPGLWSRPALSHLRISERSTGCGFAD